MDDRPVSCPEECPGASSRCALALQVLVGALLEFESVALPDTHRVQHAGGKVACRLDVVLTSVAKLLVFTKM